MPEIPDVIPGEPVESDWGNQIRNRTVQRYTDATERDALVPFPVAGDLAWLDTEAAMTIFDGSTWVQVYDPAIPRVVQVIRLTGQPITFTDPDTAVTVSVDLTSYGIVNTNRCTVNILGGSNNQFSNRTSFNFSTFTSTEINVVGNALSNMSAGGGGGFFNLYITEYDRAI